jgi:hypothetical protein
MIKPEELLIFDEKVGIKAPPRLDLRKYTSFTVTIHFDHSPTVHC